MANWLKILGKKASKKDIPKVDASKADQMKLLGVRSLSNEDRDAVASLKSELIASGFLEREEKVTFEAEDDFESAFAIAGEQGNAASRALPTYDSDLDDRIEDSIGGINTMIEEFDEDEDTVYDDVYTESISKNRVEVKKSSDNGVEVRLPDGRIVMGRRRDK